MCVCVCVCRYDVECPASADYPAGWYIQNLDSKEADNPNNIAERVLTPCDPPVLQPPPQAAKEEEEEEGNTSSGDVRRRVKKRRTAGGVDGASGTGDASDDSDHVTGWFECEFNCGYEYKDQAIVEVCASDNSVNSPSHPLRGCFCYREDSDGQRGVRASRSVPSRVSTKYLCYPLYADVRNIDDSYS